MDLVGIRKAWGAAEMPYKTPRYGESMGGRKTMLVGEVRYPNPGPIPSDWRPYDPPKAGAARKAKMLRRAKVAGAGAAGAAGLVGAGLAARAARAARRSPAKITSQVSGRTLAAIGAGGVTAGVGGSLVARKRKKGQS